MGHFSPALVTRSGQPCASTILIATLVQELPKDIVGTHCCAKLALDHISATTSYVMWHDSVLQRVHLSSLVYGEELLASNPTYKLKDHPLLTVFNIFMATFHIWRPFPSAT